MVRFFKQEQPAVLIVTFIACAAMWAPDFAILDFVSGNNNAPLYKLLADIAPNAGWLVVLLSFLSVMASAYLLISYNTRLRLIEQTTYLPAVIFAVSCSALDFAREAAAANIAAFMVLLALHNVLATYKAKCDLRPFFGAGLLVGGASLVFFPAIFFMAACWYAVSQLRGFVWREWAASFLGLLAPYYFYLAALYLSGANLNQAFAFAVNLGVSQSAVSAWLAPLVVFLSLSGFLLALGVIFSYSGVVKKIAARKAFNSLLIIIFVSCILVSFRYMMFGSLFAFFAAGFAFYFSLHLVSMRKQWKSELLFFLFIAASAWAYL
jgi:hypothetical protein